MRRNQVLRPNFSTFSISIENIDRAFQNFEALIPPMIRNAERQKWPDEHNTDQDHYAFIADFARSHLTWLDEELPKKLFA